MYDINVLIIYFITNAYSCKVKWWIIKHFHFIFRIYLVEKKENNDNKYDLYNTETYVNNLLTSMKKPRKCFENLLMKSLILNKKIWKLKKH